MNQLLRCLPLVALLPILNTAPVFAQQCGTPPPSSTHYAMVRDVISRIDVSAMRNAGTTCVPLQAHVVRMNDGSGGISNVDLNIGLSFLNAFYYDAGIEFFWKGMPNTVNNTDYYAFDQTAPDNDTELALVGLFTTATNAVNIYFVNSILTSDGFNASGYAYYPFNSVTSNRILMTNGSTANTPHGTFAHEFGHYFDLFHTHEGTENGPGSTNAENVPRTGGNANCVNKGDLLCDTHADPKYSSGTFNTSTCTYTGGGTDINGVTYTPPVDNIMSYYPDQCGGLFTPDQYTRITQGLVQRQGHSAYSLDATPAVVNVPSGLSAVQNGNVVDLSWTDNAGNEMGYLVERSIVSGSTGFRAVVFGATGPNGTAWSDQGPVPNTTNWYRVKASNGDCNTYSNVAMVNVGLTYCEPDYFQTCAGGFNAVIDEFILVGATTITNSNSNCSPNGFGDFTAMTANLVAGGTYSVSADALVGTGSYVEQYAQVWIDLDQNGSFEDAGEKMLATPGHMNTDFTANFTVPASALNGTTRLRIRSWDAFNGCDPTSCGFCAFGETEEYTVVISGGVSADVNVNVKVMLEGPFDPGTGLMNDDVRAAGLVPLAEPFTAMGYAFVGGGGESIAASVLNTTGSNAIVDWVTIELRDKTNSTNVLASRSALVQRDGDVVDVDGTSAVTLATTNDNYYVAVRHRNHLGCMSAVSVALSGTPITIDLTTSATAVFGTNARKNVSGTQCLWTGDASFDGTIKYAGSGSDREKVLTRIGGSVPTNVIIGYHPEDLNMDAQVKYAGSGNDRDKILTNIGGSVPTSVRIEQIP